MSNPSLIGLFEPPEDGYVGTFGWICGYSADLKVLNAAAARFTTQSEAGPARRGKLVFGVMLDPRHEPMSILDMPGVADLPLRRNKQGAFRLMHAKLALLGFRSLHGAWCLRAIVSTGNWTQQTLEQSLDLAWSIEVRSDEIGKDDDVVGQRCADVAKVGEILQWLRGHYDDSLIASAQPQGDTALAAAALATWLERCAKHGRGVTPHVFDNRQRALAKGLSAYLDSEQRIRPVRRNLLALGSGFFESSERGRIPSVLKNVVDQVKTRKLLTQSASVDVYVNPDACQAVANAQDAIASEDWSVRTPKQPSLYGTGAQRRTLHAKFIFSANSREAACTNAWLYLGSGNLTGPGFIQRSGSEGNFEAGVFLTFDRLPWDATADGAPSVATLLPLQRDSEGVVSVGCDLASGDGMPERPEPYLAGPVSFLDWQSRGQGMGGLSAPSALDEGLQFAVLNGINEPCECDGSIWLWPGDIPRQAKVRWREEGKDREASVPVVDELGRIAAGTLPALELTDLAAQLMAFPMPPDEDDDDSDGTLESEASKDPTAVSVKRSQASSPVRTMMQQLEQIADRQTQVKQHEWAIWCCRLRDALTRAADSEDLKSFLSWGLNPLDVLLIDASRPQFASKADSREYELLRDTIKQVAKAWGTAGMKDLGGEQ